MKIFIPILLGILTVSFHTLSGQPMRVMSYNIRYDNPADGANSWPQRRDFLATQINAYGPDVLGIQESLPNQLAYLDSSLTGYSYVGQGRDEGGTGESTSIFFRKKRFELQQTHTFWLSETPDQMSKGWDAAIRRICTYVLLYDKDAKQSVLVFNTHFDHIGLEARMQSARLIVKKMKELNPKNFPVILMGDFNATPESEPVRLLDSELAEARQVAEVKSAGPEGSFNAFDFSRQATQLIDHVFVSSGIAVKKYAILVDSRESRYPSDHFPVCVEISVR